MSATQNAGLIKTSVPARLDRLRWGRFHTLIVLALGITWVLDGLEVTLAGAVAGALKESPVLQLTNAALQGYNHGLFFSQFPTELIFIAIHQARADRLLS